MVYRWWIILPFWAFALSGCFSTRVAENIYQVGEYKVTETIYQKDGFPDPDFERIIRVKYGYFSSRIGSYTDESPNGISIAPEMVGEWLVIYSSSHIFLWQPGEDTHHFSPHKANGWIEYANLFGPPCLNEHYDYHAALFWIEDGRRFIRYDCEPKSCEEERPASILFTSDDDGITYTIRSEQYQHSED
jgi:hypothetical protein